MATWVNLNRAAKFPEVMKVYKRAGGGQGGTQGTGLTTPASALKGFLALVRSYAGVAPPSLPSWIRYPPGAANDWQNAQVDVTAIPGVRPLNTNGKWTGFVA